MKRVIKNMLCIVVSMVVLCIIFPGKVNASGYMQYVDVDIVERTQAGTKVSVTFSSNISEETKSEWGNSGWVVNNNVATKVFGENVHTAILERTFIEGGETMIEVARIAIPYIIDLQHEYILSESVSDYAIENTSVAKLEEVDGRTRLSGVSNGVTVLTGNYRGHEYTWAVAVNDSASGTGTENGSGNGSGTGTENGSGNGSGTGTENGSGNGSGTGTENGSGNGSGTGTENGSGNGSGTGTENGSGNGSGTGTENGSGDGSGTGTENGTGDEAKPGSSDGAGSSGNSNESTGKVNKDDKPENHVDAGENMTCVIGSVVLGFVAVGIYLKSRKYKDIK